MRYLKVTLLIGAATSAIAILLHANGAFSRLDQALWHFLGHSSAVPPRNVFGQAVWIAFLGFGIAWTTIDISRLSLKIVVAAGALAEVIMLVWVVNLAGAFYSPFAGLVAVALGFGGGLAYALSEAGGRKRDLRLIFGDRISTRTFYALVNSRAPLRFAGELRETTVLVCEFFNHNELVDSLPVEDYVAMTNLFLRAGSDLLVEKGGYLDECDGETLRVIFGAPLPDERHAVTACEAALELVQALDEVNRECERRWARMLDFRVGVNSGEMVAAAYGSRRLGTFSVAGEPVEFARRLCVANLIYGSRVLVGTNTFGFASGGIEVRPIELIRGRDDRSREEVYELLGLADTLSEEELQRRDLFWKGVVYFREQRWDEALEHFRAALSSNGTDGPVEFYIRRVEQLREGVPALEWETPRF